MRGQNPCIEMQKSIGAWTRRRNPPVHGGNGGGNPRLFRFTKRRSSGGPGVDRRSAAVLGDEGFDDFNDLLLLPLGQPGNGVEVEPGPSARLRSAGRPHALA
jgi:hypothetical protein